MLTRRRLVASTAALALLGGCAIANQTADQIKADIQTIAAGLAGLATAAASFVPPNVLAQVQTLINTIESNAALIANAVSGVSTNSLIQNIANAISALSVLLAPFFPQAPVIAGVVQAAIALISFVLQAAGITPPAPPASMKGAPVIGVDEARSILKRAAEFGIK